MKTRPYPPKVPENDYKRFKEWTDVVLMEESGTWICPPLFAIHRNITQFKEDKNLQKRLLGPRFDDYLFIHIDLLQHPSLKHEDLYRSIKEGIFSQTHEPLDFESNLLEILDHLIHKCKKVVNLLVTGADTPIRNENFDLINELNFLAERNWQTHVLLFLETDITHPSVFPSFSKKTTLAQNIQIVPFYTREDHETFLKYMTHNWNMSIPDDIRTWMLESFGGYFLFSKEILRYLKKNPDAKLSYVQKLDSLRPKIHAVLDNLSEEQKLVLAQASQNKQIKKEHEYTLSFLVKQDWIRKQNDKYVITAPIFEPFLKLEETISDMDLLFSKQEQTIFDYLTTNKNIIISREDLAKILWKNTWETQYSDWAIDQLIHRLREKIQSANLPYKLTTKRGEGFVLLASE